MPRQRLCFLDFSRLIIMELKPKLYFSIKIEFWQLVTKTSDELLRDYQDNRDIGVHVTPVRIFE